MICYNIESQYTNTSSPQPYFVAHYGRKIDLDYNPDIGWWVPQWPQDLGEQPSAQAVLDWIPAPAELEPLTDVEILFGRVQGKLNADEAKRTGKPVNPGGAVPLARAIAASAIIYAGWSYPSEADLETEFNQFLLSKIYEDPTTNTTAESSVAQKRSALHFTLVMLAGQEFGLDYQAELGAYERTASGEFQVKLADDQSRDWLGLPCPKMHPDFPAFDTIRLMFRAVMK